MISLPRFKGRRVTTFVHLGAACLMVMVFPLSPWLVWIVLRAAVLLPMGLTLGPPMLLCLPHWGETSITPRALGPHTPPHHPRTPRKAGRDEAAYGCIRRPVRSRDGGHDASHTEETIRASRNGHPALIRPEESQEKESTPEPEHSAGPGRNHTGQAEPDAEPEQNHTASKQGAQPDTAAQAAEQVSTGRPADTSNGSTTNGAPPKTRRRTEQP